MIQAKYIAQKLLSDKTLDFLCLALILCVLIYELPATAIAQIGASYGMFEPGLFYTYRLNFSIFVIGVASLNILINHRYLFSNRYFLLYIFFISYMLAILWFNREVYGPSNNVDTENVTALEFFLPILFKYPVFFLVGLYLPRLAKSNGLLLFSLFILFFMVVTHIDLETMGLKKYVDSSYLGNYLFLGDATSIISLISLAFTRNMRAKIALTILSAVALFFIGSRTSFAVFTGTIVLYFVLSFKPKYLLVSAIFVIAAGVGLSSYNFDELAERNSRMFGVVTDFDGDNSVEGRKRLSADGWYDIKNNPVMGNFGGQLSSGQSGITWRSYMHDVFSYWRQFGILAFIIIVAFVVRCCTALWKNRYRRKQRIFALYFLVSLFLIVETAFSRSFVFYYAHLFFGLTVALNYTMISKNRPKSLAIRYFQPRSRIIWADRTPRHRKRRSRKKRKYPQS